MRLHMDGKKINVLEFSVIGKNKEEGKCEDKFFFNNDFVAVIDGATSKSDLKIDGDSTGRKAAEIIWLALNEMQKELDYDEATRFITDQIFQFYIKNGLLSQVNSNPKYRCSASAIIYSKHHHEIWLIGDCHALVNGSHISNNKPLDDVVCNARSLYVQCLLATGEYNEEDFLGENDPSREFIIPLLTIQNRLQNRSGFEFSYSCFDGFELDHNCNKRYRLTLDQNKIVFASDGYPVLFDNLADTEKALANIREEDPICYKVNKSTKGFLESLKSFDDRCYVSFELLDK